MEDYCKFFLKKNGKIIYLPINNFYSNYLCTVKKIIIATPIIISNAYYGKDEDDIVKKLVLLENIKNNNLKYIIINEDLIYLFNNNVKNATNIVTNLLFLSYIVQVDKKMNDYFYGNILKTLTTSFMISKIRTRLISNKKILIYIFYDVYIFSDEFKDDFKKKYDKTINDFPNYHELYLFLKKTGYVNKFYNNYSIKILNNYKKFYKKILEDERLNEYKIKTEKAIKNFDDLDLLKIIKVSINNKFNKKYIKNKFIELTKKI